MINNRQLLLESLDWKSGDFIPNYGYYYGLINNKLIFLSGPDYPFNPIDYPYKFNKIKNDGALVIEGIKFRIPTSIEVSEIFQYRRNSYLSIRIFPHRIYVSDSLDFCFSDSIEFCFNTLTNKKEQFDVETLYNISVLLINSIDLNIL